MSVSDQAVIDHMLIISSSSRCTTNSWLYQALATELQWNVSIADSCEVLSFIEFLSKYYESRSQFPTTVLKYEDGGHLTFTDHSTLCNLLF